jgi:hypothetical protein
VGLKFSEGAPKKLHTPLGEIKIFETYGHEMDSKKSVFQELKERFGLVEMVPQPVSEFRDVSGLVYAITIDAEGKSLPQAEAREKADFIPYDDAMKLWKAAGPNLSQTPSPSPSNHKLQPAML